MRTLGLHLDCLRQLDREKRRLSRAEAFGFIAAGSFVALALAGAHLLEQLAIEKLGLR